MSWCFGSAVRTGSVHGEGAESQDFALAEEVTITDPNDANQSFTLLLAIVCDGAGSATAGALGAKTAATSFRDEFVEHLTADGNLDRSVFKAAFKKAVGAVAAKSTELNIPLSELSCTLLGAASADAETYFFQIGDGASIYRIDEDYRIAIWPPETEFVNTTVFVTHPDAERLFQIRRVAGCLSEIAVLSDGLQYLVLDHRTKQPHQKFFHSVSEELTADGPGSSEFFAKWIGALLESDHVRSRTDDDTSLVFAKRLVGSPCL